MRFVHIADMHFGNSFSSLQSNNNFIEKRKYNQKQAFDKIIEYIKDNNIEHFFIAGDLFEQDSFNKSSGLKDVEYCNKKFSEIPNTKIWISPGNHDPYIKNSYYQTFLWSSNVVIFKNTVECYETSDADFYGYGFGNFYENNSKIEEIYLKNPNKLNILICHADIDASKNTEKTYNPISSKKLLEIGFDYMALGHIHKPMFSKNSRIIYPGSTICLSFGSGIGNHGFVTGEISKDVYNIDFITLDSDFYIETTIDISDYINISELIQSINNSYFDQDSVYQITLTGKRKFYIDETAILRHINIPNVLKIKDETSNNYDYKKIALENNLKGYFVREMLEKLENCSEEEIKKIQMAMEIGLASFE